MPERQKFKKLKTESDLRRFIDEIKPYYYGCLVNMYENDYPSIEGVDKRKRFLNRLLKYANQYRKYGFDDTETWSLDCTTAYFMIPRLKRFIELVRTGKVDGVPAKIIDETRDLNKKGHYNVDCRQKWIEVLKSILFYLECVSDCKDCFDKDSKEGRMYEKGMEDFKEYFENLWW